jgi:hypothetical protein
MRHISETRNQLRIPKVSGVMLTFSVNSSNPLLRQWLVACAIVMLLVTSPILSHHGAAQDEAPQTGSLQIFLSSSTGVALNGSFAVYDSAGGYQEAWVLGGVGTVTGLAPGQAGVSQLSGTVDNALHLPVEPITILPGDSVALNIYNTFLDADGDGIGDSADTCASGSDVVDTDSDGVPDACDATPKGDNDGDGIDNLADQTPDGSFIDQDQGATDVQVQASSIDVNAGGDSTGDENNEPIQDDIDPVVDAVSTDPLGNQQADTSDALNEASSSLSVEIADELEVVAGAPVSCQAAEGAAPWIVSDLDDYPPGGLVTLIGGGWIPGQTVEIVVDDDGIADAEQGPWIHTATVTAGTDGKFVYAFNIAPWFVADYTVVATGECSEARTAFTDSVQGGNCVQVSASDVVAPGQYVMFRCTSTQAPIRVGVTSITSGWQWAFLFSNDPNLAPPAYASLNWNSTGSASDSSASGNIAQAYFFLSPTSTFLPGGVGTVNIDVKNPSGNQILYSSTLGGYRALITANFQLACTPTSSTVPVPGSQQISCTLSTVGVAGTATVNVSIPAISAPTGWTVTAPSPSSGTVTQVAPFTFAFTLTPSCAASPNAQPVSIGSNLTFQGVAITGPSTSVSGSRATGTTASVAIDAIELSWSRPYAFTAYPTNAGSLSYTVQASGCAGWNVTLSASPFVYQGPGTRIGVPASNLTLTGSTLPAGTGITAPVTSGSLDTNLKVLSASLNNGIGTFSQTLNMNLAIPAGTLVGTYQSTVTITVASGP